MENHIIPPPPTNMPDNPQSAATPPPPPVATPQSAIVSAAAQEPQTKTFGEFLKSYFQQCLDVLKHPKQLIPTLILGVIWIVLSVAASFVKLWLPFQALSFLTFAQGGMYGGFIGAIGGIVGKVIVATFVNVMIVPLFTGQKSFNSVADGAKALGNILKVDSMKALGPMLIAFGASLLFYSFLNFTQIGQNAIIGVVAAVMLLKNIGTKGGFAWDFLLSATGAMSGRKMPHMQTINRILTGMAFGFTLGAALSLIGLHLCVWIGLFFSVIGTVFTVIGREKNL